MIDTVKCFKQVTKYSSHYLFVIRVSFRSSKCVNISNHRCSTVVYEYMICLFANFLSRGFQGTLMSSSMLEFRLLISRLCQSQWPRSLKRRSVTSCLLRSWVRIPPGAWMFVCFECCVLSGRGLCDELITCPKESYRL